jgi:endo-1,4-beta-xylanase
MKSKNLIFIVLPLAVVISCKKNGDEIPTPPPSIDTATVKGAVNFTTGVAISYDLMRNNAAYSSLVMNQFDRVTFEFQMKHQANVQNNGTIDFARTDELVNLSQNAGLEIFGHTLIWHQNNNGTYLNSLTTSQVDNAMKSWITAMVTRYKGKLKGWDVVNEAFLEDGNIRTGANSGNTFHWYSALGRSYIGDAFKTANQADPDAVLFLNDYNLEHSAIKRDSLVKMVDELKSQTVPIHGIGTQMHININTSNTDIDNMFIKLAATGLKIHVSELDIRINPGGAAGFVSTQALLDQQAAKYRHVAESYIKNVPAAQRFGITVWNLTDADSWIVTSLGQNDFPTLWDKNYNKKPAHGQFVAGLKQ